MLAGNRESAHEFANGLKRPGHGIMDSEKRPFAKPERPRMVFDRDLQQEMTDPAGCRRPDGFSMRIVGATSKPKRAAAGQPA
jgi:hypothetical protein